MLQSNRLEAVCFRGFSVYPVRWGEVLWRMISSLVVDSSVLATTVRSARGTGRKGPGMAKNIYVGNLVWDASADDLLQLFQQYGNVARAQVIMDRETGRSRGFGFVEMDSDAEASKAIDALNNQMFRGRALTVNEARPREEHGGGGGGYGGGGGRGPRGGGGAYGGGRGGARGGDRY